MENIPVETSAQTASKNSLALRTVSQLFNNIYYIPEYQRGYRWQPQQITELLNDINAFKPEETAIPDQTTWYCLQPLAVKKVSQKIIEKYNFSDPENCFEVIDGQQRLTTIFIILHYLNLRFTENRRKTLFEIHYATRERSWTFLKNELNEKVIDNSNIDFSHMSNAYKAVFDWFTEKQKDIRFDENIFESKLLKSTKVIWYESREDDSIALFTRINIGKIPLTNAELIKALFLNTSNFKKSDQYDINLKQLEIAHEWDNIEYSLQNPSFWYFINEKENLLDTRIEFIFNLMSEKPENDESVSENFTFDYFSKKFKTNSTVEVTQNWDEIKLYFQKLTEWFDDRKLYHKIGFLITFGEKIPTLIELSKGLTKKQFRTALNAKIKRKLSKVQLSTLSYPKPVIKRILLLHNIQTMLNNSKEDSRFPFDRYKQERWDIEHINSAGEEMPENEKHQQDWLNETVPFLEKNRELKDRALNLQKGEFSKLYHDIIDWFNESGKTDGTDGIGNLVLLDSKTNRGYKNSVYPVKRSKIIERDKNGTFIPICTRNVFLKFNSLQVSQMTFWGEQEQKDYFDDIKRVLLKYLSEQLEDKKDE
ncbi:DUF262 domain-containing protein [Mucilaginibacter angelicae]|uniref:DUF262 domain-containing protein n=1 Tax=Mucilaginibacter angelicae TaxID=869718 RepID=A0ABV6L0I2_9SPHI